MSTNAIDAPIPDPVLDGIAAIPNPENLAIALNRYPLLDPRNPTIVEIVAGLRDGYWVGILRQHLADLAKLDAKALQKRHKKLQKAPANPFNIWIDAEPVAEVVAVADVSIGEAATASTGTEVVSAESVAVTVSTPVAMINAEIGEVARTGTVDIDEAA